MSTELSPVVTWTPIVISLLSLIASVVLSVKNYQLEKRNKKQNEKLQQIQLRLGEL